MKTRILAAALMLAAACVTTHPASAQDTLTFEPPPPDSPEMAPLFDRTTIKRGYCQYTDVLEPGSSSPTSPFLGALGYDDVRMDDEVWQAVVELLDCVEEEQEGTNLTVAPGLSQPILPQAEIDFGDPGDLPSVVDDIQPLGDDAGQAIEEMETIVANCGRIRDDDSRAFEQRYRALRTEAENSLFAELQVLEQLDREGDANYAYRKARYDELSVRLVALPQQPCVAQDTTAEPIPAAGPRLAEVEAELNQWITQLSEIAEQCLAGEGEGADTALRYDELWLRSDEMFGKLLVAIEDLSRTDPDAADALFDDYVAQVTALPRKGELDCDPAREEEQVPSPDESAQSDEPVSGEPDPCEMRDDGTDPCIGWRPLLGRWRDDNGGVIDFRMGGDDTVDAVIVSASERMTKEGYAVGDLVLRGLSNPSSGGTWMFSASRGEAFMAALPDREPGEYLGTPEWIGQGVTFIETRDPNRLTTNAQLMNRFGTSKLMRAGTQVR